MDFKITKEWLLNNLNKEEDMSCAAGASSLDEAVDKCLGIELLPPIRVSVACAEMLKKLAADEGIILQAFVRNALEEFSEKYEY